MEQNSNESGSTCDESEEGSEGEIIEEGADSL